jgi:alkylated DNA repair dioxygenase AlkB
MSVTEDLFQAERDLRPLGIPDADVLYAPSAELPLAPPVLLERLIAEIAWREEDIVLWGRKFPQPRLIAWYGDAGASYTYSGVPHDPLSWTKLLLAIKESVERATAAQFNSVLLNYYRHERDSMGLHSDDEPELGPEPVIASVSLGEVRTFVMRHKKRKDLPPVRLPLASGSLLLMRGPTQRCWRHGIDKEVSHCGPRVNLTFRRIR